MNKPPMNTFAFVAPQATSPEDSPLSLRYFIEHSTGKAFALDAQSVEDSEALTFFSPYTGEPLYLSTLTRTSEQHPNLHLHENNTPPALLNLLVLSAAHQVAEQWVDNYYQSHGGAWSNEALFNHITALTESVFGTDLDEPYWQSVFFLATNTDCSKTIVELVLDFIAPTLPQGKLYAVMPEANGWQSWINQICGEDTSEEKAIPGSIFGEGLITETYGWTQEDIETILSLDVGTGLECISDSAHTLIRIR